MYMYIYVYTWDNLLVGMAVEGGWRHSRWSGRLRRSPDCLWVMCFAVLLVWTVVWTGHLPFFHFRTRTTKSKQKLGQSKKKTKARTSKPLTETERINESESYDVVTYIGILSFLWDVLCRSVRILVVGIFLGVHFLISQTLIGKLWSRLHSQSRVWFYYCLLAK